MEISTTSWASFMENFDEAVKQDNAEKMAADIYELMERRAPDMMKDRDRDICISQTVVALKNNVTDFIEFVLMSAREHSGSLYEMGDILWQRLCFFKEKTNTFTLYQVKGGEDYLFVRFEPLDRLKQFGRKVQKENYQMVYHGHLGDHVTLEDLYQRFNMGHFTDGYTGRSMSVSDVVVVRHGGIVKAFYCDSFGFKELTEFFEEEK